MTSESQCYDKQAADSTVFMTEQDVIAAARYASHLGCADAEVLAQSFQELLLLTGFNVHLAYRVLDRLGRGRQGVVLKVQRHPHRECVTHHAMKVFDPAIYVSGEEYDEDMDRIARQVGCLQRLYHPNLVQCAWLSRMQGVGVMMMELVDGVDLDAVMDREAHRAMQGSLPPEKWDYVNTVVFGEGHYLQPGVAFYVLRKILRGLEVLHRVGYIHCDVKPSNIMIDRFGTVKLIDFGRALAAENPTGPLLGSPMYMAPEAHQRQSLTPVADLYSAGIVTLELLHGGHLIPRSSTEKEILEFKLGLPDCFTGFLPDKVCESEILVNILRRLIAVSPAERYPSATEAETGLEGVRALHQQLARAQLDSDYGRELENYLFHRLPAPASICGDPEG